LNIEPGYTFMATIGKIQLPMKVLKITDGMARCQSMDLKYNANILVQTIEKFFSEITNGENKTGEQK